MVTGLAHVCVVTDSMTITRARIEVPIPRKRRGSCSNHDKAVQRFYDTVMQAVLRHIRFEGKREREMHLCVHVNVLARLHECVRYSENS